MLPNKGSNSRFGQTYGRTGQPNRRWLDGLATESFTDFLKGADMDTSPLISYLCLLNLKVFRTSPLYFTASQVTVNYY